MDEMERTIQTQSILIADQAKLLAEQVQRIDEQDKEIQVFFHQHSLTSLLQLEKKSNHLYLSTKKTHHWLLTFFSVQAMKSPERKSSNQMKADEKFTGKLSVMG